ncbi:MAG: TonB-dependent receptor, partial [Pseudomonadota bacterium]
MKQVVCSAYSATRFGPVSFLSICCLLLLPISDFALAKTDQEAKYLFDIPRLRADKALIQFAQQANVTVLFPYDEVKKRTARPLRGIYSVRQALTVLLRHSGITIDPNATQKQQKNPDIVDDQDSPNPNEEEDQMKNSNKTLLPAVFTLAVVGTTSSGLSQAQGSGESAEPILEEVITIGTRSSKPRSVADSPVPVDVFNSEEFNAMGGTADITDNLKTLVPSYTATPATGDGSAFVRPTSMRGMAPDQSLVLVNGKRRHRSSLVQFFAPAAGNGAHGVDIAMIPGIALKSVEVLRDGAAAQYGSDAIAGVMNFVLKDAAEGGELQVQAGEHFDGEGNFRLGGNIGLPLGTNGFVNLSVEHVDNDALSRGIQRQVAQDLIDSGVEGVGADAPFGDAPFVQTWGRPETRGTRWFVNSAYELENGDELYAFGNNANTFGRYRFFYRNPTHSTIMGFLNNFGSAGDGSFDDSAPFLPAGYTPFLDGRQNDSSMVVGLRGETDNELSYDFSVGWGRNELRYSLNNTLNPDLPPLSNDRVKRDFAMGGYNQEEININADFSKALSDNLFLSYGAEWRQEKFTIVAGETDAVIGAGTSGLRAADESNAGSHSRNNYAAYVDVEHDVSDAWLMQYALRFEDFSDFGSTVNGKVATRYSLNDTTNLRAAISTGFHAPTPGQSNVETVITTFDGVTGNLTLEGLVPSSSAEAEPEGGKPLEEEESLSFSLGVSTALGPVDLTVDGYFIQVDGR